MTAPENDDLLDATAEVMERQARVARAEATLAGARRRLDVSVMRLSRIATDRGAELSPAVAAVVQSREGAPATNERPGTLRARIVAVIEASPGEVFTPASLAPVVGHSNRDSIRNTLLVLAGKGQVEKVGAGQYQARRKDGAL